MIRVTELTRRFSGVAAVDSVSFSVGKGEVVGFLGPNGAGKTTTLRMLTCFLPPTSGTAVIAGSDIVSDPLAVRRNIGYLPESVPLYTDMRVSEYLGFRARLKGLSSRAARDRIGRVCEQCGILSVRDRIVGHLSKGFRQRVGMADALVSDPPILFLDEPTSGLDPNQIRDVRDLISELGKEKTVVISTHILPEVEATCRRAIIIDKGRIAADGSLDDLRSGGAKGRRLVVRGKGAPADEILAGLKSLEGVLSADRAEGGFEIRTERSGEAREAVFKLFSGRGWVLTELSGGRNRLEEVFWRVTGFEIGKSARRRGDRAAGPGEEGE